MTVTISPNIKRESVRLGADGNSRNKSGEVIIPAEDSFPVQPIQVKKEELKVEPTKEVSFNLESLTDIKTAIQQLESQLVELKEVKKQKVEQLKKELEEAEAE